MPLTRTSISRARRPLALVAAAAALACTLVGALATRHAEGASPANVIFILTDDQTYTEMSAMPNTQVLIGNAGVTFKRAYVSYPLCCPSRATLLTGQFMHNHGVRGNLGVFGGWPNFIAHESNALPVWMHRRGYYDVHIGKYMNLYTTTGTPPLPVPPGWDQWYGKISQDSLYFNYQLIEKTGPNAVPKIVFYGANSDEYQTDEFEQKAHDFIDKLTTSQQPFMMNLWFNAPHGPFEPAPRHLFTLSGTPLPKLPGFNEKDISDKPKWLRKEAPRRLNKATIKTIADERRRREEQLRSVDESVGNLVNQLAGEGILDDTYIIFASDNGFFRGEHRIAGGKYLAYEPSSHVPLMIRGPGIPAGGVSDELVHLGDIPQTILDISGDTDPALDSRSLLPFAQNPGLRSTRPILLEADTGRNQGGDTDPANASSARASVAKVGVAGKRGVKNLEQEADPIKSMKSAASGNAAPAYRAIRTDRYLYVLYANGQTELYDMLRDPAQLNSLAKDPRYKPVRKFLLSQLIPLSTCSGSPCTLDIPTEPLPLAKAKPKPAKKKSKGGQHRSRPNS